jgi:hypothetical protein
MPLFVESKPSNIGGVLVAENCDTTPQTMPGGCAGHEMDLIGVYAPCEAGNVEGSVCYKGSDGYIWDVEGHHSISCYAAVAGPCVPSHSIPSGGVSAGNGPPAGARSCIGPPKFSAAKTPPATVTPVPSGWRDDGLSFGAQLTTNPGLRSEILPAVSMIIVTGGCLFTGPVGCTVATGISLVVNGFHIWAESSDPVTGKTDWGLFAANESVDVILAGVGWMSAGAGGFVIKEGAGFKPGFESFDKPLKVTGVVFGDMSTSTVVGYKSQVEDQRSGDGSGG